jgi:hypothetical protein
MADYLAQFQTLVADLDANPHVTVTRKDISPGSDPEFIKKILQDNGLVPSRHYVEFFQQVDRVHIEWEVTPAALQALGLQGFGTIGRIDIESFEMVMDYLKDPGYWFSIAWREFSQARPGAAETRLVPFDYVEPDVSGCVCLDATGGTMREILTFFTHQDGTKPMGLDIPAYCKELVRTRGAYGWQRGHKKSRSEAGIQVHKALTALFAQK